MIGSGWAPQAHRLIPEETNGTGSAIICRNAEKIRSDLGLPKVDIDKLMATHAKNFEALGESARIASEGAKSVAAKQKEIVEASFRDAVEMVRELA